MAPYKFCIIIIIMFVYGGLNNGSADISSDLQQAIKGRLHERHLN